MSSSPRLGTVLAKVIWAETHLQALNKEILTYLDVCEKVIQMPTMANPKHNTIRLTFNPLPEPDWRISLRIGDCVYNVRSSLDHLWKRLGSGGNFPMFGTMNGAKGWTACRSDVLSDIPLDAHAIIDGLQPCVLGEKFQSHPLAILNRLARIDKHEALHLTKARAFNATYTFTDRGGKVLQAVTIPLVLHDETEINISGVPDEMCKPDVKVNIQGTLFVTFKQSGPWDTQPVQEVLRRCIDFVKRSVMAPLRPYIN